MDEGPAARGHEQGPGGPRDIGERSAQGCVRERRGRQRGAIGEEPLARGGVFKLGECIFFCCRHDCCPHLAMLPLLPLMSMVVLTLQLLMLLFLLLFFC